MIFHKSRWQKKDTHFENSSTLCEEFHVLEKTIDILQNRGINTSDEIYRFLNPSTDNLYDPFLLKDMDLLVDILEFAKDENHKIYIYGDYDVDGMTSISILYTYLKSVGYDIHYYIPDRFKEGYGLNCAALDYIKNCGADLVITVDCGITAIEESEYAQRIDLPLFITDHHTCHEVLPDCLGIINPKQLDCPYPYDMLCGAGISLKIVQALSGDSFKQIYKPYMEIAAIGTIADLVPLLDENRTIAQLGLATMLESQNFGIRALLEILNIDSDINSGHVGFGIAPRLNAAGRIDSAYKGVELLISDSYDKAKTNATILDGLNKKRQSIELNILNECIKQIEDENMQSDLILVLCGKNRHVGVVGIVASRISEIYHKPTIVLGYDDNIAKGSARSVGDFNIFNAMNNSKHLFEKFGGHKLAAGVSLKLENVKRFRVEINDYAKKNMLKKDFYPLIKIDGELVSEDISYDFVKNIEALKPFGLANSKPKFIYKNLEVDTVSLIGKDEKHLKLTVHDGTRVYECIKFNATKYDRTLKIGEKLDMVFTLDINKFRGVETIQFGVQDIFIKNRITKTFEKKFYIALIDYLSWVKDITDFKALKKSNLEDLFHKLKTDIDLQKEFKINVGSISALRELEQFFIDSSFESYDWEFAKGKDKNYGVAVINTLGILNPSDECINIYHIDIPFFIEEREVYFTNAFHYEYSIHAKKLDLKLPMLKYIYKELLPYKKAFTVDEVCTKLNISSYILYLALKVFEEMELMTLEFKNGKININILNKAGKKVEIMNSKILSAINKFN